MAEAITVACPQCGKKVNVPADAVGKKIRCKGCETVFPIPAPAEKKAAKAAPAKAPAKAPAGGKPADAKKKAPDAKAPPPGKPADDEDDKEAKPYGVTALDTAPRCPDCANEMDSEDAIICLHCGYNTRTREKVKARSVEEVTGWTWTLWLLPGILCALGVLILFTFDMWWTVKINAYVSDGDWSAFIAAPWFVIWCIWAPSLGTQVALTTFAVRRLILHPRPPEREKRKPAKKD